jgi:ligand-binding SRPBCC domain-containing protein
VLVRVETIINAPVERCFDLARSIDFHLYCARSTHEKVVGGVTSGLISLNQEVEWKARHFFLWFTLRVRITEFARPVFFQDSMVRGPFKSFRHGHSFKSSGARTEMIDEVNFESPVEILNQVVARHLEEFLRERNLLLKTALESDQWRQYLPLQET